MRANGMIWWSTPKATVALIVRNGTVIECAPYATRWALGHDADALWRRGERDNVRLAWLANLEQP